MLTNPSTQGRVEASFSMNAMSSIDDSRYYDAFYFYGMDFQGVKIDGKMDKTEYMQQMTLRAGTILPDFDKGMAQENQ